VNASLVIDLNSIPSAAVERVEVITGGASSTYGADAVGGVVNFILKRNFEGMVFDAQFGITEEGDAEETRVSALIGANIGERGNVMFGGEWADRGDAFARDHNFFVSRWRDPTVGGTDFWWTETSYSAGFVNQPTDAVINSVFADRPPGTVIGRSSNFFLNDDGTLYAANGLGFGSLNGGPNLPGGTYRYNGPVDGTFRKRTADQGLSQNDTNAYISTPLERYSLFGRGNFGLTDNLSVFVQGNLAQTSVETISQYSPALGGWSANIPWGTGRNCRSVGVTTGVCQNTDPLPANLAAFGTWANVPTLPAYQPNGSAGLTCPATGGCSNTQAFASVAQFSPELAALLNNRTVGPAATPASNEVWSLNEVFDWLAPRGTTNNSTTFQLVGGFEGRAGVKDWTWEAYISHGQSTTATQIHGVVSLDSWRTIVSAPNFGRGFVQTQNANELINGIPGGGNFAGARVTCTSGLPIMESFQVSQDCIDALTSDLQNRQKLEQTIYEANLQGALFDGWAGETRFAAGVSRRTNDFEYQTDRLTSINNFLDSAVGIFPLGDSNGRTSVNEVYGEVLFPVLADIPLVRKFELELGYRYSDYNPSGSVDTYKALADWQMNDYLRLRGGYQFASRAPNVGELFSGRSQLFVVGGVPSQDLCHPAATNPLSANPAVNPSGAAAARALCEQMMGPAGAQRFYVTDTPLTSAGIGLYQVEGNAGLKAEEAQTWTAGFVAGLPTTHPLFSGLRLTADWYEIHLEDAITTTLGDTLMNRCFSTTTNPGLDPQSVWCTAMERNPDNGQLAVTNGIYSNEARYLTAGYDVQLDWRVGLADMGTGLPGYIGFNFQASFLDKFNEWTTPTATKRDWKDFEGPNLTGNTAGGGGSFKYRLFTTLTYNTGTWGATLRYRYMPSIQAADELTAPGPAGMGDIAPTPSYDIFDLSGTWTVSPTVSLRAGVDNLFDKNPPITGRNLASTTGMTGGSFFTSGSGIYDPLGRRYYLGVTANF